MVQIRTNGTVSMGMSQNRAYGTERVKIISTAS